MNLYDGYKILHIVLYLNTWDELSIFCFPKRFHLFDIRRAPIEETFCKMAKRGQQLQGSDGLDRMSRQNTYWITLPSIIMGSGRCVYLQYLIVSFHLVGDFFHWNHDYGRKGSRVASRVTYLRKKKVTGNSFETSLSFREMLKFPGGYWKNIGDSILLEYKDSGYNVHIPYIQYFEVYFGCIRCIPNNTQ